MLIYSDTERDPALFRVKIDKHSRALNTQLLYSYRVNAQPRFFVGYSDNSMQDAGVSALEASYRTVFAKFSYARQYGKRPATTVRLNQTLAVRYLDLFKNCGEFFLCQWFFLDF